MGIIRPSISNSYLRRTSWHKSPYRGKWQQIFNEKLAMETLKNALVLHGGQQNPKTHFLNALINSFGSYGCPPSPSAYSLVFNFISQRSLFSEIPPLLDHLEKIETFEIPERIFIHLILQYGDAGMLEEALNLFSRIPKFRCSPSAESLNALLCVLCRKKEGLVLIHEVLVRTLEMNIRLEESSFKILIKTLCKIGKCNSAIEILNLMGDHGCIPDSDVYSIILLSLCKHMSSVEVNNFLDEMSKVGFLPNLLEYGHVISVYVKEGKSNAALDVLNQMKMEGIKPDVVCYTSVLDGLISSGEFRKGDQVFDEMLIMGIVPDVFTYSVYINGLCKQGDFEGAIKMLACMEEVDCKPNVVTYNTLMTGLAKVGDLDKVKELRRKMGLNGIEANLHTYTVLIDGFVRNGEVVEGCNLLGEMLTRGYVPRATIFYSLICGLCELGLLFEAFALLEVMVSKMVSLNPRAWEALLIAVVKNSISTETMTNLKQLVHVMPD